jgi:internalin A
MTGSALEEDLTSLWEFRTRLKEMGHFPTEYDNTDQLLAKFSDQIEELLLRGL